MLWSSSWGGSRSWADTSELRNGFIAALRSADRGDLEPLLAFARQPWGQ